MHRALFILVAVLTLLVGTIQPAAAETRLVVFAAASLTETLQQVEPVFEKAHPGVDVILNLAASSRCRIQIEQGAPADVFMSANAANMNPLVEAKLAEKPTIFAHNRVVIITPKANPGEVAKPGDLAKSGLKLVTCSPEVPIGKYTRIVLGKMDASGNYESDFKDRVLANVVSEEPDVKGIVTKVRLGEADGGICYASDVTRAVRPDLRVIDIPDNVNVIADYPIAILKGSDEKSLAGEFVSFMLSQHGQRMLAENGFIPISPPSTSK